MLRFAGLSDIGLKRSENQDSFSHGYNLSNDFIALVCDGVGGSVGGSVASNTVSLHILNAFKQTKAFASAIDVKKWIEQVCQSANDQLLSIMRTQKQYVGMATTISGVVICNQGSFVFNIGDSRVYGLFDKFICLTRDHNYERYTKENQIKKDTKIRNDALSNALGIYSVVKADILKIKNSWKKLLICSDGVHNSMKIEDILRIISADDIHPTWICETLIQFANHNGGSDNITAVVIERVS